MSIRSRRTLLALAGCLALLGAPAQASKALSEAKNCTACHAVDKRLVGPSFKEVATRYAGQKDAVTQLAERIQKGSIPNKGNWGAIPMPANTQVSADEARTLASWVLSLK